MRRTTRPSRGLESTVAHLQLLDREVPG
jgi:hypothetical protein